jgi:hypothetical protein
MTFLGVQGSGVQKLLDATGPVWSAISEIINQRPAAVLAGLLFGLSLLLAMTAIVTFWKMHSLQIRQRQMSQAMEAQAAMLIEKMKAYIDEKIETVSVHPIPAATAEPEHKAQDAPVSSSAALMREELASLQMDLLPQGSPPPAGAAKAN